jgi:hypothetical protein
MEKSTWISFSEAELLDSGMSRSTSMELPSLQISEGSQDDEEAALLYKIQNIQLQLAEIRELKVCTDTFVVFTLYLL